MMIEEKLCASLVWGGRNGSSTAVYLGSSSGSGYDINRCCSSSDINGGELMTLAVVIIIDSYDLLVRVRVVQVTVIVV